MKKLVLLFMVFAHLCFSQTPFKKWVGLINASGQRVEIRLNLDLDSASNYTSSWDIPAQKTFGLPSTKTEWDGNLLYIEIKRLAISFTGRLTADGLKIQGIWGQSGGKFPLNLEPFVEGKVWPIIVKPQTPQGPYPYSSEDFVYQGQKTKLKYGATLTFPKDSLKHPLLILITGSGAQNRDETLFDHKPFAVMADYFTKNGYVVMRVDDRGVGKSNGVFLASTSADFALDVEEHLNYAKKLAQVDSTKMGLVGHSEGGLIAQMVSSRNKDVAFVVMLAAPGVDIPDLMVSQNELILNSGGLSKETIQAYLPLYRSIIQTIKEAPSKSEAVDQTTRLVKDWVAKTDSDIVKNTTNISSESDIKVFVNSFVETLSSKWWKYFLSYRPAPFLEKISVPVLAINGSNDIQVLAALNLTGIKEALTAGNNKYFTIKSFKGLNHMFQKCKACNLAEYGELDTTIEPEVLSFINTWLENAKTINFRTK